jgi:hypothetical protein
MRILSPVVIGVGALFAAAPAAAQTYDPNFPVCLQVYGVQGVFIECRYTSLGQCAATASGRAAQCLVNPLYAGPYGLIPGRAYRRQHHI